MWYRLAIDLDAAGNVKGASYEVRSDDGERQQVTVLPQDHWAGTTPSGMFDHLMGFVVKEHGLQAPLWPF